MLAFSTCWLSHRYDDGFQLAREMRYHGIRLLEISHGTKVSLLPGILRAYQKGIVNICGVHNFCPSPVDVMIDAPDAFEFTSHRESEKARAIKLTKQSIDTCEKFGGKYLVVHCGSVPIKRYTRELEAMLCEGKSNSREYVRLKHEFIAKRRKMSSIYLQRIRDAIDEILPYAEEKHITIALESRSHYEQAPNEEEMIDLLEQYNSPHLGYWHDFGHVQRKDNLGLLNHFQYLERMKKHVVGCHVHDVVWPNQDHSVPFKGSIDFGLLLRLLPGNIPLVWELNPRRKTKDIMEAWERWTREFGGEYIWPGTTSSI